MNQDWTPVVLDKRRGGGGGGAGGGGGGAAGGAASAPRRTGPSTAAKLDADTETFAHATVDRSLSQAIQQARLAKKVTQKDLAQLLCVQPSIIAEYENGRAIPNGAFIAKLERALGAKLPRPAKK